MLLVLNSNFSSTDLDRKLPEQITICKVWNPKRLAINTSSISKATCTAYSETGYDRTLPYKIDWSEPKWPFSTKFRKFKSILYASVTFDTSETNKKLHNCILIVSLEVFFQLQILQRNQPSFKRHHSGKTCLNLFRNICLLAK